MIDWEKVLERKLTKKFLSPNAVRDGFIESYCVLLKAFQQKQGNRQTDAEINDNTFALIREIYRVKDIHYEIPPKPVILKVDEFIKEKLNINQIKREVPEAFLQHEKVCRELINRMDIE
ncbi:MAG: hypothetical protein ACHQYP_11860 [Nitrospiria bacterium]